MPKFPVRGVVISRTFRTGPVFSGDSKEQATQENVSFDGHRQQTLHFIALHCIGPVISTMEPFYWLAGLHWELFDSKTKNQLSFLNLQRTRADYIVQVKFGVEIFYFGQMWKFRDSQ